MIIKNKNKIRKGVNFVLTSTKFVAMVLSEKTVTFFDLLNLSDMILVKQS